MGLLTLIIVDCLLFIHSLLSLYIWVIIIGVVLSWLVAFNVVNGRNRFVQVVGDFIFRLTEPLLQVIRNKLPAFNGIDLSPLFLFFLVYLTQHIIEYTINKLVM